MGRHLARALLAQGRRVTVLDLAEPPADLLGLGARFVRGSITDQADVERALDEVDGVIHLAAKVSDFGPRAAFVALNLEGTRTVVEAARAAAGVRRFVQVSSVAVFDYRRPYRDAREDEPAGGHAFPYGQTKHEAEQVVAAAHGVDLETTIARPGLMPFGPEDHLSSAQLLAAVERRLTVLVGGGRALLSTSYVDNLVQGLLLCLDHPAAGGGTFHLSDEARLTWRELVEAMASRLGVRPNLRSAPRWLAYPAAALFEAVWTLARARTSPPLTRYRICTATQDLHFSPARAIEALGYAPAVSLEEGLDRTVEWYRSLGA
jgi:2-alkyl-3-oxoalkanoate reductase